MSDEPLPMMQGKFQELKKMSKEQKDTEITAWRNLWSYLPSEVKGIPTNTYRSSNSPSLVSWMPTKYYLLKSGTTVAITMRNYKRHLGVLLSTRWDIKEMEIGVYEKEYDQTTGNYFFERKIIKLNPQGIIDMQWIQERIEESKLLAGGDGTSEEDLEQTKEQSQEPKQDS